MLAWITVYSSSCCAVWKHLKAMTWSCFLCDPGTSGSVVEPPRALQSISRKLRSEVSWGHWILAGSKPALVINDSPLEGTKAIHWGFSETRSKWLSEKHSTCRQEQNCHLSGGQTSQVWEQGHASGTYLRLCVCTCCKLPTHSTQMGGVFQHHHRVLMSFVLLSSKRCLGSLEVTH